MEPIYNGIQKPSTDFGAVRSHLQSGLNYIDVDLTTARTYANALVIPAAGNFFYIDQKPGSGIAQVYFEDLTPYATAPYVFPGSVFNVPFTQFAIIHPAQPGLVLRVIFATDTKFTPSNVAGVSILNSVSIVDGGRARTLAGQAFMAAAEVGPVAGQYSALQLWNPATETKRRIIKQFRMASDVVCSGYVRGSSAALTTLDHNPTSKLIGGTASTSEVRTQNNAAPPATIGNLLVREPLVANATGQVVTLQEPIVLNPGFGLVFYHSIVNTRLWVSDLEFAEESV